MPAQIIALRSGQGGIRSGDGSEPIKRRE
jgi:hypothetical protein